MSTINEFYSAKGCFFDLDGCIYRGTELVPGAVELLGRLRGQGKQIRFVTNNSRDCAADIADKLRRMGIEAEPREVFAATDGVGRLLQERNGGISVKVIGSAGLEASLQAQGHRVLPWNDKNSADAVVIGRDTEFSYDKLLAAANQIVRGARGISANPDTFHPGPGGGRVPETGSIAAAIEAIVGVRFEYAGKPAEHLFRYAMESCGLGPEECVMVGDNLRTDILGGNRSGLRTVWIRGAGMEQDPEAAEDGTPHGDAAIPDLTVWSIADLLTE